MDMSVLRDCRHGSPLHTWAHKHNMARLSGSCDLSRASWRHQASRKLLRRSTMPPPQAQGNIAKAAESHADNLDSRPYVPLPVQAASSIVAWNPSTSSSTTTTTGSSSSAVDAARGIYRSIQLLAGSVVLFLGASMSLATRHQAAAAAQLPPVNPIHTIAPQPTSSSSSRGGMDLRSSSSASAGSSTLADVAAEPAGAVAGAGVLHDQRPAGGTRVCYDNLYWLYCMIRHSRRAIGPTE